jgi:hypothetical protein
MSERTRRAGQGLSDMARSLGLVLAVVAVLLLIGPARTLVFPGDAKAGPVDYTEAARSFARVTAQPVVLPDPAPLGWRCNAAGVTTAHSGLRLHIGWALPGSHFVELEQSAVDVATLARVVLGRAGASVQGHVTVGGDEWELRRSQRGEQALTRTFEGLAVVVTGDDPSAQRRLAIVLRPAEN